MSNTSGLRAPVGHFPDICSEFARKLTSVIKVVHLKSPTRVADALLSYHSLIVLRKLASVIKVVHLKSPTRVADAVLSYHSNRSEEACVSHQSYTPKMSNTSSWTAHVESFSC